MRLAGHTYSFRHEPLAVALDQLQAIGFGRVELWAGHVPAGGARAAAAALRDRGLELVAVGIGGIYRPDPAAVDAVTGLAAELGASRVVACSTPAALAVAAARLPAGVTLCVENHWDQQLARPRDVLGALASHPQLQVQACLDTGHALLAGVRPEAFAEALGSRLGHVHLKEARLRPLHRLAAVRHVRRRLGRPAEVRPGAGDLDVARLRGALAAVGYEGAVSLEFEGPAAREAVAELLRLSSSAGRLVGPRFSPAWSPGRAPRRHS